MIAKNNCEVIGNLKYVNCADGKITLTLAFEKEVEVPQSAFDVEELKKYVGSRVGVFNDGQNYQIRKISPSYKNKKQAEGDSH